MAATVSPAAPIGRKRRMSRTELFENIAGFLFISPWIFGFLAFEFGPLIAAGYLSLTKYDILTPPRFAGLANFDKMFTRDPLFWKSLWVTAIYSLSVVFLGVILGVMLAVLLNQRIRGMSLYRTVYYLPAVVSGVAVAYMWSWVFRPEAGIINYGLSLIGITGPNWLFSTTWTLPAFVIMSLWAVGGGMVLYLAGLQGVPTQLYEAASLDGATRWASFWNVTLPMISPVIFFNFIIGIIGSFQVFTSAFVITKGGPANSTLFFVLYLYRHAFENFKMGYAAALGMILFLVIMTLTIISFRLSNRLVYYEGRVT
ncbi:MAG: sugar ABC transporter permease [Caldilineaceae bacterium]|nr:sugar ABC transporter permease [Caldilineaceae bacterium]